MAEGRPSIPAELRRRVLVEAGHRCAIPTCRQHPVDIEHIDDWARVKKHEFENLIALCPTCHRRKGNGANQIDRKSLRQYKANLAVLNSRYGDIERRLIELYAGLLQQQSRTASEPLYFRLGVGTALQVMYLVQDGYLVRVPWDGVKIGDVPLLEMYQFTEAGTEFVKRWAAAQPIDPGDEAAEETMAADTNS
jgi:cytochrome c553